MIYILTNSCTWINEVTLKRRRMKMPRELWVPASLCLVVILRSLKEGKVCCHTIGLLYNPTSLNNSIPSKENLAQVLGRTVASFLLHRRNRRSMIPKQLVRAKDDICLNSQALSGYYSEGLTQHRITNSNTHSTTNHEHRNCCAICSTYDFLTPRGWAQFAAAAWETQTFSSGASSAALLRYQDDWFRARY